MDYKIGDVKLKSNVVLAPMAGITDIAFRIICKRFGAGLVYTEMVNANAIARNNKAMLRKIVFSEEEKPVAVQIFGAKTELITEAAKIVEKTGADMIDFNLGCPDLNVINQGAGSALLKRPKRIQEIISALAKNTDVPITAKIRTGVKTGKDAVKIAKVIEKSGASAIIVHARTVEQGYSGKADWEKIKDIKEAVNIPVIGNGDVFSAECVQSMIEETGCDFVMIGRAAMSNPHIFAEANDYLKGKEIKKLNYGEKLDIFFEYAELANKFNCFDFASAKRHALNFTKGIPNAVRLRDEISKSKDIEVLEKSINIFKKALS